MQPTVRAALQNVTEALDKARKLGGPKTPEGKSRSSMNALRHGLSANNLLLPGEDAQHYESHLDSYFATFVPANLPEATIVAQIGDLSWKLERLSKLENNRLRARLEEELEKTDAYKSIALTRRALQMVNALAEIVDAVPSPPNSAEGTSALLDGVEHMVMELGEVPGLPLVVVQPLSDAIVAAKESLNGVCMDMDAYKRLGNASKLARGALTEKLAQEEPALEPVRERLAAEVLLLEDKDLKNLERHRRLLESSMARQLDLLARVRSQVASMKPEALTEARELRVKLRVVR